MSEKCLKETWKFFPRVSKYVHWQSGSYREGEFGNLGGWLQFGGLFPAQKADVWPTPKNSVFLVFSFSPTFFGRVYFQQKQQGHLKKKSAQVYHCFKYVQNVIPVVSVSLSNLL